MSTLAQRCHNPLLHASLLTLPPTDRISAIESLASIDQHWRTDRARGPWGVVVLATLLLLGVVPAHATTFAIADTVRVLDLSGIACAQCPLQSGIRTAADSVVLPPGPARDLSSSVKTGAGINYRDAGSLRCPDPFGPLMQWCLDESKGSSSSNLGTTMWTAHHYLYAKSDGYTDGSAYAASGSRGVLTIRWGDHATGTAIPPGTKARFVTNGTMNAQCDENTSSYANMEVTITLIPLPRPDSTEAPAFPGPDTLVEVGCPAPETKYGPIKVVKEPEGQLKVGDKYLFSIWWRDSVRAQGLASTGVATAVTDFLNTGSFDAESNQSTPVTFDFGPPASASPPPSLSRADAIWARATTEPIVLDGVLNEASWAQAESVTVTYGVDSGVPGSGWRIEAGTPSGDSTHATIKFLVEGNQLYLGAIVPDKSIGGSAAFNRFDGLLMAIKDHLSGLHPKPPAEYFYAWWNPNVPDPQPIGAAPNFMGRWGSNPIGAPRDAASIANWDAVTAVNGTANSDDADDVGYTVEMRMALTPMGYDVTRPQGDIIEWNVDIYDTDWFWPEDVNRFVCTRTWWESPWGSDAWYDQVQIHASPAVTVSSGPVPTIAPDFVVGDGSAYASPTVDGALTEPVWASAPSIRIRYGDDTIRQSYLGVGPYRAGQFQPTVNGRTAPITNPADATVKMFVKGSYLYMGFDVNDKYVQYHPDFNRWDGFIVTIDEPMTRQYENNLAGKRLTFFVNQAGGATATDDLLPLEQQGAAQVMLTLKPGTTVDTLGNNLDAGYTAELVLDLTALGYEPWLGDRVAWLGVALLNGDSFGAADTLSYGSQTWWYRRFEGECCPAWTLLSPTQVVSVDGDRGGPRTRPDYALLGSYPNPAVVQTIRYSLPERAAVTFELFDIAGRLVERRDLGAQVAGVHEYRFDGHGSRLGIYFYRLRFRNPVNGSLRTDVSGHLIVIH